MTKREIAEAFSNGRFTFTYPFLSDEVVWTVIGENQFAGKDAVIENCEKTSEYFAAVNTDFKTLNVICENNRVAITGTANFKKDNKLVASVFACDVYEFDDDDKLVTINSYCIQDKMNGR